MKKLIALFAMLSLIGVVMVGCASEEVDPVDPGTDTSATTDPGTDTGTTDTGTPADTGTTDPGETGMADPADGGAAAGDSGAEGK